MQEQKTEVVILAAGKGTRMYSNTPKVLHNIAGKTMLEHVIVTAKKISSEPIHLIYGHGGERLKDLINDSQIDWTEQKEQLGTGHAVKQVIDKINPENNILILYADVPLLTAETLEALILCKQSSSIALLTASFEQPGGYGRIIRDKAGNIVKITEEKDATEIEKLIREINTGIMLISGQFFSTWLNRIDNNNAQQEYYLTDIVELAIVDKQQISSYITTNIDEVFGVNNKQQLAYLERQYQRMQANKLLINGTTLADPERIDIRGTLTVGKDVKIDINVIFEGDCYIGDNVVIEANSVIRNSTIGNNSTIFVNSLIEDSIVESNCQIGPYARLRPQTHLKESVKVGNFVEIKKSTIEAESKVNHLTYIGDTEMGSRVNVGAGTITCNYDGANKHLTQIGDNVFIGSNSALVAPVIIEANATIAAGSTITKTVADSNLAITRTKQISIENWQRPSKNKQ
ncbi:MAG: bifunctional UDP-N-acetylglucosamine diphosphorylase/glucosamine-1-phosphate N-acetyltransferase GlmU [Gammaproteobacteria bacterium]|nr:bifunctional UDP-N-acetylglucosamine diphosphorylase/glucosamine-1-phosphate N-acetyltransferase GlmU [Gammaproteobacteria bacterium]